MQTRFTEDQLQDPDTAASNAVLRACVHCGFCSATCPTYALLGDERDSPRGRIYLMREMLERDAPPAPNTVRHIDRCLSCLACMTTCPSGVNYLHLVDHARAEIERRFRRPWHDRLLRVALAEVLTRPVLLRAAIGIAQAARPWARWLPGRSGVADRLRAMLALAPARMPAAGPGPGTYAAEGTRRARVALLTGCAQSVLGPGINSATIRLLTRLGAEVVVAPGAGCCGALPQHMGRAVEARATMRRAIAAWQAEAARGLDAVVINTSGCGTTVKEYGHLFRAAPVAEREAAETIAGLAVDVTEFLERLGYAPARPAPGLRVAYHAACSLQHGQRVTGAPMRLLAQAGFEVVTPAEAHLCCGSAGTYNLLQPEIAGQLRARKLARIGALAPDVIAAGNLGCLMQLAGSVPVAHTVELLDWMAGGLAPDALAPARRGARAPAIAAVAASAALLLGAAAPEEAMLDALARAPDEAAAAQLEHQITTLWHDQATDAVQVLEDQAVVAVHTGHPQEALQDMDAALQLQPEVADLWRRRGEIRFALGDDGGAASDLAQALSRQKRLFPALADASRLAEARGRDGQALAAWQRYLQLDPKAPGGEARLKALRAKVEGQAL